ncbi:MAG: HlyD family efflux transporter periplasmic adaptor subunit [Cyanobacteria bacterium P01_A01_bin.105]
MVTAPSHGPWNNRNLWIALAALVVVGGVSLYTLRSVQQARQAEQEEAAAPIPERVSIAALGRVEPDSGVIDVASSENGVIAEVLAEKGDVVAQGQPLIYLDIYEVRKAERDYAASQLEEARRRLAAETQLGQARIQAAATLENKAGPPQTEAIRAQQAAIDSIQAQLDLALIDLNRFTDLHRQGAISLQVLQQQRTQVAELRSNLASSQATKAQLAATQVADLDSASAQVLSAEANLALSQIQAGVVSAEQNLVLAEARLALALVTAPIDGEILDISAVGEPSSSGLSSTTLLSVANTDEMIVVAEVYETDIGLVAVGQSVTITSRNGAFEETLTGTVRHVGRQIGKNDVIDVDPAADADSRVVEVDIAVEQDEVIEGLSYLDVDVLIEIDK